MSDYKARIDLDSKGFELGVNSATESNRKFKESTEKSSTALNKNEKSLNDTAKAVGKHKMKVAEAERQLKTFQSSIAAVQSSLGNMMSGFSSGSITGFMQGVLGVQGAIKSLQASMIGATGSAAGLGTALNLALGPIGLITAGIAAVVGVSAAAVSANADLEDHVSKLSSLTGATGDDLKYMKELAIEMSKDIHMASGDIVDAFMLVGSAVPSLLQNKEALSEVTRQAMVLSKVSGMDAANAVKSLTTVINQMNVPASQAADIINTLAAGSKQGAADIPYLATAFEKAGTQAKSAGMDFVDLTAAIETVRPKFSSADVAGSQLNSTLLALSVQAEDKFKPAVVGMKTALDNLAKAELDDVKLKELVGASNITMIKTLIESRNQYEAYTESLRGTLTAYDQFAVVMDTLHEDIEGLKQAWNAFLETLGSTGVFDIITGGFRELVLTLTEIINKTSEWIKAAMELEIVKDLVTLISGAIKFQYEIIKTVVKYILEGLKYIVKYLNEAYTWLKNLLGLSGKKVEVEVEVKGDLIPEGVLPEQLTTTSSPTKTPTKPTSKTPTRTTTPPPAVGSLQEAENKLNAAKHVLQYEIDVNDKEAVEKQRKVVDELQQIVKEKRIALGLEVPPSEKAKAKEAVEGSLKDILKKISDQKLIIEMNAVGSKEYNDAIVELQRLSREEQVIKAKIELDSKDAMQKLEDYKKAAVESNKATYNAVKEVYGGVTGLIDSVKSLAENWDELDGWELFEGLIDTTFGVIDAFNSMSEAITTATALYEAMTTAKEASTAATELNTAAKIAETGAVTTEAAAEVSADAATTASTVSADATLTAADVVASTANQVLTATENTAAYASIPFVGPALAAAAQAVYTGLWASASIPMFADGGIVPGGSFTGDSTPALLNANEMVLNNRLQANLFRLLNGELQGGADSSSKGEVEFKIKGSELVGVLTNYNKKLSKIL